MFSDLDKASLLKIVTNLTKSSKLIWSSEEAINLLNLLDPYLDSCSPSVVLVNLKFLLIVIRNVKNAPKQSAVQKSELEVQVLKRCIPTLLNASRDNPEASHQVFALLLKECSRPELSDLLTKGGIDWCTICPRDPPFLVLAKIDMLVFLVTNEKANPTVNAGLLNEVLSQLFMWTTGSNIVCIIEKSLLAVTRIRSLSLQILLESSDLHQDSEAVKESLAIFQRCLSHMLDLLDQPSPPIVAGALCWYVL